MDTKHCSGCRNHFYNGNNPLGVSECWMLKSARLVKRKRVHISQVPPWNQKATMMPNCYSEAGFVFVGPEQTK